MALLSASLVCAVAKMTVEKGKEVRARAQATTMVNLLEDRIIPQLKILFEDDARVFQQVIDARLRRDDPAQANNKRRNTLESSDRLKDATDILFEVVDLSFQTLDNGLSIWEIGFQPAMGDAGAGISAALAAITTCLLVANVNLRSARSSWSREAKGRCDEIYARMKSAQERVFQLVLQSVEKAAEVLALPLEPGEPAASLTP
jgi:formiminotetrahydrofolate cyclodeaminase